MPLLDRAEQKRWTRVGAIRLGEQVPTGNVKNGKPTYRPAKLETFRITSPSQRIVAAVAEAYKGEVRPWQGASGPEFEVITDARELPVLVPPQRIDPNYELYGARFLARMCDGVTESKRNCPCLCRQGDGGHTHQFDRFRGDACTCGVKRECKVATRLSLMLAEIQGLGTFKLESHGGNAADELPMTSEALEQAAQPIPALLMAHARSTTVLLNAGRPNEKVERRDFVVPVLIFDWLTPMQAFGGQIAAAARAALGGGEQRPALASTPAEPTVESATTAEQFKTLARLATDPETIRDLWERAKAGKVLDEDLKAYFTAKAEKLGAPMKTAPANGSAAPSTPPPPVGEVVEAETEPDGAAVWTEVVGLAGDRKWNMTVLAEKFEKRMGFDYRDDKATGWKLAEFRDALKAGAVQ